ncbi:MAG: DUF373 family protein [Nanoarchaeota archaeon]
MDKKDRILILNVDRDDDIGQKAKIAGPIIGKENVIKAAVGLGLADPEDSDTNAIFQTARVYEELKKDHLVEVAVLTGHKNVGMASDKEVTRQLNEVLDNFTADYAVLVTDGAEDEHVLPIIQSKLPILSVSRVVVKQSEKLESTYYKVKDFIDESLDNPKFSRIVFGLPALALILYALFGIEGWRLIVGVVGAYLFVKGFKLEKYFRGVFEELSSSLTRRRFAFFSYVVAASLAVLASFRGYTIYLEWVDIGLIEAVSAFISSSIYFYFASFAAAWIGRNIGAKKRTVRKVSSVIIFGFAVSLVVNNAALLLIEPEITMLNFFISIVIGFAMLFVALLLEWK